jgi:hypothetical protein
LGVGIGEDGESGRRQQRKGAIAPYSWAPEESEVKSCEHQDNANIHGQPFPESVSEEHEIYTDDDRCHRRDVEHGSYLSAHVSKTSIPVGVHQAPLIHQARSQML